MAMTEGTYMDQNRQGPPFMMSAVQIDKSDWESIANLPFIREIIQTLRLAYSQNLRRGSDTHHHARLFLSCKKSLYLLQPDMGVQIKSRFLIRPSPTTRRPVDCENSFCKKLQILKSSFEMMTNQSVMS